MSRVIDLAINEFIFDGKFSNEDIMRFSDNMVETLALVHFLSDEGMNSFNCTKLENQWYVTLQDQAITVFHRDLSVSLSLACLASTGLDMDYVRDIKFEYNFEKGIL